MFRIFKSKVFILLIVTVTLFVVIGLTADKDSRLGWIVSGVNSVLSPLQKAFTYVGDKAEGFFSYFEDSSKLKVENEKLKVELNRLEKENRELLQNKDKIQEFREVLNLKNQLADFDSIGANIIAKDAGNWFGVFTVDRGTDASVYNDYAVIARGGLAGRVLSVGPTSSKIISVIDKDFSVSARIAKTNDLVVVRGDISLKEKGLCRMDYIPPEVDIAVGDKIETSGMGGLYPKGILIGTVVQIRQSGGGLDRYAVIQPDVDFKKIEEVFILKKKQK